MRPLFTILGLLLSLTATRADDLPVIKDSDALQYIGKNVEVRGLVVSVTTSPLGTACISFGREFPDQTFAGFIAAGSKMTTDLRIATLQGKIIGITWHNRTLPREAADRSHGDRSDQRFRFSGHSQPSKINCGIGTGDA
jgi:hypothetical protein